jgi:hypothetical protein
LDCLILFTKGNFMKRKRKKIITEIAANIGGVMLVLVMSFSSLISQTPSERAPDTKSVVQICKFSKAGGTWQGSCGPMLMQNPTLIIAPADAITTGIWRKSDKPMTIWTGAIKGNSGEMQAIEIEIYDGGSGVMRSAARWFPVSGFALANETLVFQLDTTSEVPPNELDREIIRHAAALLSSESVWNRADTRVCAATDTKWSIYCAIKQATIEVTGAFHHRRPAFEVVRRIVDKRTATKNYKHRLMDYNNDPLTRSEDIRTLFAEALTRMER